MLHLPCGVGEFHSMNCRWHNTRTFKFNPKMNIMCVCLYVHHIYIFVYIYIYMYTVCVCVYGYIYRERERRESAFERVEAK